MKALDANVLVRFLVADDPNQALRTRRLFEQAERSGASLFVTTAVLLETLWVLSAVYDLDRGQVLDAVHSLAAMPILELEDPDLVHELVRLGAASRADLADLLIGLCARTRGCDTTLTFEHGLDRTGLFERL